MGVFQGMRACLNEVYGSPLPQGRSVAIQGVGSVGTELVKLLTEAGATVTIADVDQEKVDVLSSLYHVQVAQPEEIHKLAVDALAPVRWALFSMNRPYLNYSARSSAARPITSSLKTNLAICLLNAGYYTRRTTSSMPEA